MTQNGYLDRVIVAQMSLDALGRGSYLEIGVDGGSSFVPIKAKKKWGVDPSHNLSVKRLLMYEVLSRLHVRSERIFRMTSDEFFCKNIELLASSGIDVCLVDGLHTYEQALRDVLNATKYLKPNGIILIHDCNPGTELMARPAPNIAYLMHQNIPTWNGAWSGDVWKTIVHLRALRKDLNTFVLDCDTGLGVVTRGCPEEPPSCTENDIRSMDYGVLCHKRKELLGLRPGECFEAFLQSHLQNR